MDLSHQLTFVQHEWEKHGACSGAADEAGYFDTICTLARQGTHAADNRVLYYGAAALDSLSFQIGIGTCVTILVQCLEQFEAVATVSDSILFAELHGSGPQMSAICLW